MVHLPGESEYPYPPVAGVLPARAEPGLPHPGPGPPESAEAPAKAPYRPDHRPGGQLADRADRAGDGRFLAVRGPRPAPGRRNRRLPEPARRGRGYELANRRLRLPARAQQRPGEPAAHRHEQAVSGSRTDTIMLLHLPGNGTKPTMVSLLRDSYVAIPGHGKSKINAAFCVRRPAAAGPYRRGEHRAAHRPLRGDRPWRLRGCGRRRRRRAHVPGPGGARRLRGHQPARRLPEH